MFVNTKEKKMSFSNILNVHKIHTESPTVREGISISHVIQLLLSGTRKET